VVRPRLLDFAAEMLGGLPRKDQRAAGELYVRGLLTGAAAIGGPEIYEGRDMAAAHAGLAITEADFDAVVGHLVDTLTGLGVPDETIGQIGGALAPLRGDIVTAPADELAS